MFTSDRGWGAICPGACCRAVGRGCRAGCGLTHGACPQSPRRARQPAGTRSRPGFLRPRAPDLDRAAQLPGALAHPQQAQRAPTRSDLLGRMPRPSSSHRHHQRPVLLTPGASSTRAACACRATLVSSSWKMRNSAVAVSRVTGGSSRRQLAGHLRCRSGSRTPAPAIPAPPASPDRPARPDADPARSGAPCASSLDRVDIASSRAVTWVPVRLLRPSRTQHPGHVHLQPGQLLPDDVVDLARQPGSLLLAHLLAAGRSARAAAPSDSARRCVGGGGLAPRSRRSRAVRSTTRCSSSRFRRASSSSAWWRRVMSRQNRMTSVCEPFQQRHAQQHAHPRAVRPEVLLFVFLRHAGLAQLWRWPGRRADPLGRRDVRPAQLARIDLFAGAPDDAQISLVGAQDPAGGAAKSRCR